MGVIADIKLATQALLTTSESIIRAQTILSLSIQNPSSPSDILQYAKSLVGHHSTFTDHCNALASLVDQLAKTEQELDERQANINQRECKLVEREYIVAANLKAEEGEAERQEKEHDSLLPQKLKFNARGTRFSISKKTLVNFKGSFFEQMLLKESHQLEQEELSLDRDPSCFACVLSFYLRGTIPPLPELESYHTQRMLDSFQVPAQVLPSRLLSSSVRDIMHKWLPDAKDFQLLYKASSDGFGGRDFHEQCDGKGPTLSLICSTDCYLFGGFTPISWDSNISMYSHPDMFLFTLVNPHSILPTKYKVDKEKRGMRCYFTSGPWFHEDLFVAGRSNENTTSSIGFTCMYIDTTGKGRATFTGDTRFTTREIEVYSVIY